MQLRWIDLALTVGLFFLVATIIRMLMEAGVFFAIIHSIFGDRGVFFAIIYSVFGGH